MKTRFLFLTSLPVVAAALALTATALAFPPKKPYDPRPLLPEAAKKTEGDKFSFIVMGDVKGGGGFVPLVARAGELKPDLVLLTGDMVASGKQGLYDVLERQIGEFATKTPCFPCVGNHEVAAPGGMGLYAKFWGIEARHYSFDFKNARFICMDVPGGRQAGAGEIAWAEKLMAEARKDGKLIFVWQHVPAYTVGTKTRGEVPNRPSAFTALCAKYGVTADFAGHDHIYYRTFREGTSYIIQGVGGAGQYGGKRTGEAIKGDVYCVAAHGGQMTVHTDQGDKPIKADTILTHIAVEGKKVTGKTITSGGVVIDEFVLAGPGAPKGPPAATQPAAAVPEPAAAQPVPAGAPD